MRTDPYIISAIRNFIEGIQYACPFESIRVRAGGANRLNLIIHDRIIAYRSEGESFYTLVVSRHAIDKRVIIESLPNIHFESIVLINGTILNYCMLEYINSNNQSVQMDIDIDNIRKIYVKLN